MASALNYGVEATMGDYSVASMHRAAEALAAVRAEAAKLGLTEDDLVTQHAKWGHYVPKMG
jgi:hypothetical protein